jgi:uncharacterized protein (TIGR02996 family)
VHEPRAPGLEEAIIAHPDEVGPYAVYGDWLAQQGLARGELIALQTSPRTPEGERREAVLLRKPELKVIPASQVQWRWGFVHTLRFETHRHDGWEHHRADWGEALLIPLLRSPSCRFLRELQLEGDPGEVALRALGEASLATLQSLTLSCNELQLREAPALPLTRFALSCQFFEAAPLPWALERLRLPLDACGPRALETLFASVAPSLRELTLTSLEAIDAASLAPVLALPGLTTLRLRADQTELGALKLIEGAAFAGGLEVLDLSRSGLSAEAASRLLARNEHFPRLHTVQL